METEEESVNVSENKGKSMPCPECKKILLMVVNMLGEGVDIKMKCAYCKKRMLVQVGQKTFIKVSKIIAISFLILISAYQTILLSQLTVKISYLLNNYDFSIQK